MQMEVRVEEKYVIDALFGDVYLIVEDRRGQDTQDSRE